MNFTKSTDFLAALVLGAMVAVGGATRLTRSGLSMVTWKPHGGLPPMNDGEWAVEVKLYKQFPEYKQCKHMTVDESKRFTSGTPLAYFLLRKRIPREMYGRLGFLFGLGAFQGGIGWWMVKNGLEDCDLSNRKEVRVSPYRLATHLALAFTTCGRRQKRS
ncbi:hypothetical protein AeMF1_008437 [Aphanomyces euteiches]|nr:hypothetical protein AeMF1_008437 [Aphanomyces euteiches]